MANLNDLPLNDEEIPDVDVETVPTFSGAGNPVPQPGTYLFRLPSSEALFNCFEMEETPEGQRLRAVLREEAALYNETLGQSYDSRLSNRPRYITLKDGSTVAISDLAQLLKVVNSIPEANTNTGYGHALVKAGGRTFKATHSLTATCNPNRDIYKAGAVIPGKKGCGQRYAQEPYTPKNGKRPVLEIPRDSDGHWALRFTCTCGAELRCWGQLSGFRQSTKD